MCTLVIAFRTGPARRLWVAANRDERRDRPWSPPQRWPGPPALWAPVDETAGGSWLGLNAHGLFVALTNRFGTPPDPKRDSRGALVMEALTARSSLELAQRLQPLGAGRFNPFHLFHSDGETAHVTVGTGDRIEHHALPPGLHVVCERSYGAADEVRAERVRERWQALGLDGASQVESLAPLLRLTGAESPLHDVCVDVPLWNYGTRSSLLLELDGGPGAVRWLWAGGRPDETPFTDESAAARAALSAR